MSRSARPGTTTAHALARLIPLALLALAATACKGATPSPPASTTTADASADTGSTDVYALDTLSSDSNGPTDPCPDSPGCACTSNEECSTGVCADDGNSVTAKSCAFPFGAGCAAGLTAYTAQVGEGVTVCVPAAAKLCNPCEKDSDCTTLVGSGSLCVDHGNDGGFCGIACPAQGCPAGYVCVDATGSSGAKAKQCQPSEQ